MRNNQVLILGSGGGSSDIVDLIGSYIQVKKAGSQFRANCPFHNEKTPSFYITPHSQRFHCFHTRYWASASASIVRVGAT